MRAVLLRAVVRSSSFVRRCSLARHYRGRARLRAVLSLFLLPYSRPPSSVLACAPSSLSSSSLSRSLQGRLFAPSPPAAVSNRRPRAASRRRLKRKRPRTRRRRRPCRRHAADTRQKCDTPRGTRRGAISDTPNDTRKRRRAKGLRHGSDTSNGTECDTICGMECGTPYIIIII